MNKRLLLDGQNIVHRAYWVASLKKLPEKETTNLTIFVFLNMIKSYHSQFGPFDETWVAWDKKAVWPSTNFRKKQLAGDYKLGRKTEHPKAFKEALAKCTRILTLLGIRQIHPYVLEADDCICWLVETQSSNTSSFIVSADKDLLQLLVNERVQVYSLGDKTLYTPEVFFEKYGFSCSRFPLYKAIVGDKTDNVSGIERFGDKRAKALIASQEWEDLTKEQLKTLKRNLQVLTLTEAYKNEKDEEPHYKNLYMEQNQISPDWELVTSFFKEHEFADYLIEVADWKTMLTNK